MGTCSAAHQQSGIAKHLTKNGRRNNILTLLDMYNKDEHNLPGYIHLDTYGYRMSVTLSLSFSFLKLAISIVRIKQKRFLWYSVDFSPLTGTKIYVFSMQRSCLRILFLQNYTKKDINRENSVKVSQIVQQIHFGYLVGINLRCKVRQNLTSKSSCSLKRWWLKTMSKNHFW